MQVSQLCFALIASLVSVQAHIALWDEGMYGWDPNDPNQSEPVLPLMHLSFNDWWFHGYINKPPQEGKFMSLPSGGTYKGQVACNKALTKYGQNENQQKGIYACDGNGSQGGIGAMHTSDKWESQNPKDVKGCGIAIAYESDVSKIKPEDFSVISVNYTCPWFKNVDFQIPSNLPPCPEGGCHCMWGWIHSADAGSEQNYFLGYKCNITDAIGLTPIPTPKTANKCNYPTDISNCTIGAKQPHYWYQNERNNNPQGEYDPPFYNNEYGFINGAQTDLFASVGEAETDTSSTNITGATSSNTSAISSQSSTMSSTVSSPSSSSSITTSIAESGAYGDTQPTPSIGQINDTEPTSTSINTDFTIQTTVTIQTTMVKPSTSTTNIQAQIAIASISSSSSELTSTTTLSEFTSISSSTSSSEISKSTSKTILNESINKTCSIKRKRHLDRLLNSPELLKKHILRNERRRERLRKKRIQK
ncbi:uncharacterized protein I206_104180 [Kwoniella pini CBS 10737]|uniref:Uncharacterized protein n=1 Tax=Kwoniella pini CBS 10737 TaxID=1296096 RepID=A0A1B9I2Q4_9TREE|nr:uncharacterized protein I206_04245 [Kwoniella pini CBS 10737]OCF49721.1 hypothetical protein I206_04245 [Kwoniella pini CBS 10737]